MNYLKETKMEKVDERLEQLERRLRQARHRAMFLWATGLVLTAGAMINFWLPAASAQGDQRGLEHRVTALEAQVVTLQEQNSVWVDRVAALESVLAHFSREADDVYITGANLHIVNGLETTNTKNGVGNLIVGYNELRPSAANDRTGSHNIVVGKQHNFSSFGGLAVGDSHTISGSFASVTGGFENIAGGSSSSVSGGLNNRAMGQFAAVSGGIMVDQGAVGGWSGGSKGVSSVVGNFRSP